MENIFYTQGKFAALAKLGTEAGTITYAPRQGPDFPQNYSAPKAQMQWKEMDNTPAATDESSAFGMSSGAGKTAGLDDGGYASSGNGAYPQGGVDADRLLPDRGQRQQQTITRAFDTNENIDKGFGPEPPMTQPFGNKAAAAASTFGLGGGLKLNSGGMGGLGSLKSGITNAVKPDSQSMMPKLPNMFKPNKNMGDLRMPQPAPGMNLQQTLGANSGMQDMNNSSTMNFRRSVGNPL